MLKNNTTREKKYQLYGWLLFLVCTLFFIDDTLVHWNPWGFLGSLFFLLGCTAFTIPFTRKSY